LEAELTLFQLLQKQIQFLQKTYVLSKKEYDFLNLLLLLLFSILNFLFLFFFSFFFFKIREEIASHDIQTYTCPLESDDEDATITNKEIAVSFFFSSFLLFFLEFCSLSSSQHFQKHQLFKNNSIIIITKGCFPIRSN